MHSIYILLLTPQKLPVRVCTTRFNTKISAWCLHSVPLCFVAQHMVILSEYCLLHRLVLIVKRHHILHKV